LELTQEGPFFIATLPRPSQKLKHEVLNERQNNILRMADPFFPFSSASYAKHFSITERMARLDIKELLDQNLIKKIRNERQIRYVKSELSK
jgi:predicted HTH transcriptional regulator